MAEEEKLIKCLSSLSSVLTCQDLKEVLKMKVKDFIIFVAAPNDIEFKVVKPRVRKK